MAVGILGILLTLVCLFEGVCVHSIHMAFQDSTMVCVVQCIGSIPHDVIQHRWPTALISIFPWRGISLKAVTHPSTDCHDVASLLYSNRGNRCFNIVRPLDLEFGLLRMVRQPSADTHVIWVARHKVTRRDPKPSSNSDLLVAWITGPATDPSLLIWQCKIFFFEVVSIFSLSYCTVASPISIEVSLVMHTKIAETQAKDNCTFGLLCCGLCWDGEK
jgi:hypothetical protein